ncbi:hypothetical protein RND81_02G215500 [Saponaria officinalis]|uniref:Uncharacterized protein n=1 Tax=Saponaria officinalis TaxID=3572 RepID=A0AAW1MSY2_SAPOF
MADSEVSTPNAFTNAYEQFDDPLYLSSSDQPTQQLVDYMFNGQNFLQWKRCFLDGTCKAPSKTNKKSIRDTFFYVTSSKTLWTEILERYGQTNGLEINQLKKDLGDYYSKLKHLWESIDVIDPILSCTCGALDQCTFKLLQRVIDRDSSSKLLQLLMGRNNGYEAVKTTILSQEPLATINKALALLQKLERQQQISDVVDILTKANAYLSTTSPDLSASEFKNPKAEFSSSEKGTKQCGYCHHLGHTSDE